MDFRDASRMDESDESILREPYRPFYKIFGGAPILIKQSNEYDRVAFRERPWLGVLLFDNVTSDARDHAANERTFLSWLKLSVYMAIVSVAIVLSFHLKSEPTPLEKRFALPLGIIFWLLAMACMLSGLSNYINTVSRYSQRQAIVQTGWKTQIVFTIVSGAIVGTCILFIATNEEK
ncbi:repeatdomain-containing protein [Pyrenophora tritici-repentis]|uniref:DUF202 domain-containing protein n=2 Tax=Pyrenophora tritici-repentis TaxID=45151 RepID=A0A2W1DL38_9PLEO|nr:uncharacterized protein PTRG_00908 [Pyrenophora tritici-repentis Pt-1C-BFP]KAA8625536.1 hypothetical protein PtrV1_01216 [Pyrenophora tritici-repentis]EDU40346.1 conserved hypothetical protein [Pyrenophora tritici-repentis Pt-1C-BFP]KAF7453942.1 hypothetical protein A1F99_012000 [Pyrenophora tritici-repentis]KAF7577030.1 hypothetical protein PtrM4_012700 [Pyrenophora tritici-repentis]KAG9387697.1 hypothetical protein A1F94_000589 [Pyrenophora tritici-repentis]